MSKKYLVTGGAGFIGTNFLEKPVEVGHSVKLAVDSLVTSKKDRLSRGVTLHEVDIRDTAKLTELCNVIDVIIHLDALSSIQHSIDHPQETSFGAIRDCILNLYNMKSWCYPSTMTIDGREIVADIYQNLKEEIQQRGKPPVLSIITCAPNFETKRYLALKRKKAEAIGVVLEVFELKSDVTTDDVVVAIKEVVRKTDGVVVQLPLPATIDIERVVLAIPPSHDVDALNPNTKTVLSPVVAACKEIAFRYKLVMKEKRAVVVGTGRLVGVPGAVWLRSEGCDVAVIHKDTKEAVGVLQNADIILTGAGDPEFLTPEMIKEEVIIFDGGTSESGGELRGDVDPECARKASLFTPVPGGIGPITVACLFQNLLILTARPHTESV